MERKREAPANIEAKASHVEAVLREEHQVVISLPPLSRARLEWLRRRLKTSNSAVIVKALGVLYLLEKCNPDAE